MLLGLLAGSRVLLARVRGESRPTDDMLVACIYDGLGGFILALWLNNFSGRLSGFREQASPSSRSHISEMSYGPAEATVKASKSVHLLKYTDLEEWRKDNSYILTGEEALHFCQTILTVSRLPPAYQVVDQELGVFSDGPPQ